MKDLGELKHFLGMRIIKTNGKIFIDQNDYIRQILERFGMKASKAIYTSLAPGSRLNNNDEDVSNANIKQYQAMIDSLMYAMLCTRLDLAYEIQQLSQFNSNSTNAHFQATKRIF